MATSKSTEKEREADFNPQKLVAQVAENTANIADLTKDIGQLVVVTGKISDQIGSLALAVNTAQAPRKTDVFALMTISISTIFLLITIGGLVLYPISQTLQTITKIDEKQADTFAAHNALTLHPAGQIVVTKLAEATAEHIRIDEREIDTLRDEQKTMYLELKQFVRDFASAEANVRQSRDEDLEARTSRVQQFQIDQVQAELAELRQWRVRVMEKKK